MNTETFLKILFFKVLSDSWRLRSTLDAARVMPPLLSVLWLRLQMSIKSFSKQRLRLIRTKKFPSTWSSTITDIFLSSMRQVIYLQNPAWVAFLCTPAEDALFAPTPSTRDSNWFTVRPSLKLEKNSSLASLSLQRLLNLLRVTDTKSTTDINIRYSLLYYSI